MKTLCSLIGCTVILMVLGPYLSTAHQPGMKATVRYRTHTLEDMERFHGHVGPFVVLGTLIGEDAVTKRGIPPYFGLEVEAACPSTPPFTCILDGLQLGTGATMGKKNLTHKVIDSGMQITIKDTESGKCLEYRLTPELQTQLKQWEDDKVDVAERAERVFAMKSEELFLCME